MHSRRIVAIVGFTVLASACFERTETAGPEVAGQSAALDTDTTKPLRPYYTFRPDLRRCASPLCGGYYVALANRSTTTCADGSRAAECYVAELKLPAGVTLEAATLLHGELSLQAYPALQLELGVMTVDAVLSPVIEPPSRAGQYALAYDTGIRCITTPCPSLALATLNARDEGASIDFGFVASDAKRQAALQEAFYAELGTPSAIGTGAVVTGNRRLVFDRRTRRLRAQFAVTNVYATKTSTQPVCLIETDGGRTTAWNFESQAGARELMAGLTGQVDLLEGRCAELALPCTREFAPVHGSIDALGEACVDASNACEFRAAVIHAAGPDSKASGTWSSGDCAGSSSCEADTDCKEGFCGWDESGGQQCRAWAVAGEHCEGFVRPGAFRRCAPDLTCHLLEPTGDAGGVCLLPGDVFPCGDEGLTCSYAREYCQATIGGVPNPETGQAVIHHNCQSEPACTGAAATCACLDSHGRLLGSSCDDAGLLPPYVTLQLP